MTGLALALPPRPASPALVILWPGQETTDALLDGAFLIRVPRPAVDPPGRRQDHRRRLHPGLHRLPERSLSRAAGRRSGLSRLSDHRARGAHRGRRRATTTAGLQVAVHGNGDACIDDILDAFEAAQRAHRAGRASRRHPRPDGPGRPAGSHGGAGRDPQLLQPPHLLLG